MSARARSRTRAPMKQDRNITQLQATNSNGPTSWDANHYTTPTGFCSALMEGETERRLVYPGEGPGMCAVEGKVLGGVVPRKQAGAHFGG